MLKFKQYISEETDYVTHNSPEDFAKHAPKRVSNAIFKHKWFREYAMANLTHPHNIFRHKVDRWGDHHVDTTNDGQRMVSYHLTKTGKIMNAHYYVNDQARSKEEGRKVWRHVKSLHEVENE